MLRPMSSKEMKHFGIVGSRGSRYGYSFEQMSFHVRVVDLKLSPSFLQRQEMTKECMKQKRKVVGNEDVRDFMQRTDLHLIYQMDLMNAVMEITQSIWENTTRSMNLNEEKAGPRD